ncbi:MAG: hypothetical protein AMXMBFR64_54480 [Myxococcales bacterium]
MLTGSTSFYDIVIAGTDLSGLIVGALCAKRGYRVLVLGQGSRPSGYRYQGHTFQRRAQLFTGFDTSPVLKQIFGELSLTLEMRNRPKAFDPFYQVVLPEARIDVTRPGERFDRELAREFPDESVPIQGFYKAVFAISEAISAILARNPPLPPNGWAEKREIQRLTQDLPNLIDGAVPLNPLDAFPRAHPFRAFVAGPATMTSGLDIEDGPTLPLARCIAHLAGGVNHIEGGMDGLKRLFIQKIKQNASDYRPEISFDALAVKRGKMVAGRVRDRQEIIGFHLLICNSPLKRFFHLVPAEAQSERYHHRIHTLQPSHYVFTINLAMHAEGIPEAMARNVFLVQDPKMPLDGDNLVQIALDPGKAERTPPGEVAIVTASCRLPAQNFRPHVDHVQRLGDWLLERLRSTLFPFLDEHLVAVHAPWKGFDPLTGQARFEAGEVLPIYRGAMEATLDASVLAVESDYKNILVCGDHVFSGFGFEGAFLAAQNAYRKVTERIVLKPML